MEDKEILQIKKTCELIKLTKASNSKPFRKAEKINFAYAYWTINDQDITDLYNYLAQHRSTKNKKSAEKIGHFMNQQGITPIRKFNPTFYDLDIEFILNTTEKVKNNGNWLSLYNIEKEFNNPNLYNSAIMYSYLRQDNSTFTIDKEKASQVVGILTEQNIPTAKCIVQASFPYFAKDNMNAFVKKIKNKSIQI